MDALPDSPAWRQFLELVEFQPASIPLDLGALLIAGQAQPALQIQQWLAKLDAMGEQVRAATPAGADSATKLTVLTDYLTDIIGLRGNENDYYEPENSYLNRVIERALGIPITISVLYLEVGRRSGVPLKGIGFPGHFLLKHCETPIGYLDPFDPRRILDTDDLHAMLERVSRGAVQLQPEHLAPTTNREILVRIRTRISRFV
ncbi:MAG: transglutaminase-like domain-containing protein, partial [Myxococcota bacterium]